MSQNVCQLINLQRVDSPKKPLKIRKTEFVETYEPFSEGQTKAQTGHCLSCGNLYYEWKCPVRSYIPSWSKLANEGRIFEAAELSHQTDTLPEVCGRVYPQDRLYEGSHTLNDELGAVIIGNIERYINDKAFEMGWCPDISGMERTGKKVTTIGASPASLAYADVLTRNGVKVAVFDRHPEIGRSLTFGIPAFKLEKEVMTRRREILTGMGIEPELNTEMGRDVRLDSLLNGCDAMFLGVRTYQSIHGKLENGDADDVYTALPFLIANTKQLTGFGETSDEPFVSIESRHVIVLGGGNAAMDCMCASVRQGAKHVTCTYRRDEESMPGSHREAKSAQEESVEFKSNIQPLGVEMNDNGKVSSVKMVRTEMGEPDAKDRRRAEIVAGSEHIAPADAVIAVFGFCPRSMEWLIKHSVKLNSQDRTIAPEGNNNAFQTNNLKIFAGGDIVRGSDLVATVITEDRRATDDIMNRLEVQAE